jgi:hypothetical protein
MSEKKTIRLVGRLARANAVELCARAPEGFFMTLEPAKKKRIQEEKYHAQIGDIAKVWVFLGQKWHQEDAKRLLIDAFAKAMRDAGTPLHNDGRIVPSIDGQRVVQLGIQSREFYIDEASAFIEYLYAFGAERGVVWSDEAQVASVT